MLGTNDTTIYLLKHPIPTQFGLRGIRAIVTHNTDKLPETDTVYVCVNEAHRCLMSIKITSTGIASIIKDYAGDKQQFFNVDALLSKGMKRGPVKITPAQYQKLRAGARRTVKVK